MLYFNPIRGFIRQSRTNNFVSTCRIRSIMLRWCCCAFQHVLMFLTCEMFNVCTTFGICVQLFQPVCLSYCLMLFFIFRAVLSESVSLVGWLVD